MNPQNLASPRGRVPPGGRSSIVFDDFTPSNVTYTRVSYSATASKAGNEDSFTKRARGGLYSRSSSMKDLLTDNKGPETPTGKKNNRISPGGPSSIVIA